MMASKIKLWTFLLVSIVLLTVYLIANTEKTIWTWKPESNQKADDQVKPIFNQLCSLDRYLKLGRIQGKTVADGLAGAIMAKPFAI